MEKVRSMPVAIALAAVLHSPANIGSMAHNSRILLASIDVSSTHSDYDASESLRFVLRKGLDEQTFGIGARGSTREEIERALIRFYIDNGSLPPHFIPVPNYDNKPMPFPAPRKISSPPCNGLPRIRSSIRHCEI